MDINLNSITQYIDWPYLVVFMCLTYVLLNWLQSAIQYVLSRNIRKRLVVFLIGSMCAIPFWYVWKHDPINLLVTWSVGLAMHDYLVVLVLDAIKKTKSKIVD